MYDFTNVDPVKCCTWLVLPTVYDESLSYGEQLNKFCKALNELIENNNNIPKYVAEMIQNYITSGAIDEVVRNILANYILNVKYPPKGITPAVGDGSADDTDAIQGCIDYAFNQGGGCVYFPYGKYLSRSLTLRNGVSLVGFDRYSTRIVQRGGDTKPLISGGNVQNVQISNLTLDGNNEVQTDDLDVVNVLGKDCLFTNLVIKSGFQCFVYNGLGGDLQVDNVVFGGAVKKVAVINGKDSVQFSNVKFNELGKVQGECVLEVGASDGAYSFSSKAVSPLCISVSGNRNRFNCDIINSSSNFNDTGMMNNFNVLGMEVKEQLAHGKNISIGGNTTENITGSKTETVGYGKVENITGSKTEIVGDGKVENITGSKTEVISENKSENITGNREINIDGTDSIHVDGVSSINIGGTRTEVFGSSRSVGVTGANIEEYHDTMTENFDGKHIVNGNAETNIFTNNVSNTANKFSFTSKEKSLPIQFPDKVVDLHDIDDYIDMLLPTKQLGRFFTYNTGASTPDYDYLQGNEYDNGTIYCAFTNNISFNPNSARICKIENFKITNSVIINGIGHCNGLTVDNNYIYIASYSTTSGTNNLIYKLNKSDLSLISSKPVNNVNLLYSIAYDKKTKKYWCGGNGNYYEIVENSNSWAVNKSFTKSVPDGITQSFCVNNDIFYEVKTKPNIMFTFTETDTIKLFYIPDWAEKLYWVGEVEDISYNNGNLQIGCISHLTQYSEINVIRFIETSLINNIEQRSIIYDPSNNVLTINVDEKSSVTNPTGLSNNYFRYIGEAVSISQSPGFGNHSARINVASGDYEGVTITGKNILLIGSNYKTQLYITYATNILVVGAILKKCTSKQNDCLLNADFADIKLQKIGFEITDEIEAYIKANNSNINMPTLNTTNLYSPNSESATGIFIKLNYSFLNSVRYFKRILPNNGNTSNIMYIQDSDIQLNGTKNIALFNMIGDGINLSDYFNNYDSICFVIDNQKYDFKAINNSTYNVNIVKNINNVLSVCGITFTINDNLVNVTTVSNIGTSFTPTLNEIYFFN